MRASLGTLSIASIAVVLVACGGAFSTPLGGTGGDAGSDATTGSSASGGSGGGSGSTSSGGSSGGSSSGSGSGGSSASSSGGGTSSGSGSSGSSGGPSSSSGGATSSSSGSSSSGSTSGSSSSGSTSGSSGSGSSSGGNGSSSGSSSGGNGSSSGGNDAGTPCTSDAQCDPGFLCGYPEADGCSAKGHCIADTGVRCNTVLLGCSCSGTDFNTVCVGLPDGYVSEPLAHTGLCTIGIDAGLDCDADSQCLRGLKCCQSCGAADCADECIKPMPNGMCPLYP
jgi:hypothetical protein